MGGEFFPIFGVILINRAEPGLHLTAWRPEGADIVVLRLKNTLLENFFVAIQYENDFY
jgi:hypothetical protein